MYRYEVHNLVGFIRYVACNWFANTYYEWRIDGMLKEKVERTIGDPTEPFAQPLRLIKPIVFEHEIEWIAYNGDALAHDFGALCDGELYTPEKAKHIEGVAP